MSDIKHPEVTVLLTEISGNALVIVGAVRCELRLAGVKKDEIDQFTDEAMSGNYDHLLRTCQQWVTTT